MNVDALRTTLRNSEGRTYRFAFVDGTEMLAEVVSATHVDADDTIVILRVGAASSEPALQVHLDEIGSVSTPP